MQTRTEQVKDAIRTILSDRAPIRGRFSVERLDDGRLTCTGPMLSDSYPKSLNYAVNYCREALRMDGEDLRVQCLYIVNNISKWRHPQAREVRLILKSYSKT